MPISNNGSSSFLRAVFWALVIGSFSWTTICTAWLNNNVASHCQQSEVVWASLKESDSELRTNLQVELRKIDARLASIETELKLHGR